MGLPLRTGKYSTNHMGPRSGLVPVLLGALFRPVASVALELASLQPVSPQYAADPESEQLARALSHRSLQIRIPLKAQHPCDMLYVHKEAADLTYNVQCYIDNECRYVYVGSHTTRSCNQPQLYDNIQHGLFITVPDMESLPDGIYYPAYSTWGAWDEIDKVGQPFYVLQNETFYGVEGDPHVINIKGEKFDILQTGNHTLVHMPQGAAAEKTMLDLRVFIDRITNQYVERCYETFIQRAWVTGSWLDSLKSVEFFTFKAAFNDTSAIRMSVNGLPPMSPQEAAKHFSPAQFQIIQPGHDLKPPTGFHQKVVKLIVRLFIGPAKVDVSYAYMLTRDGGTNHLDISAKSMGKAGVKIGGILGDDDHSWATSAPEECAGGHTLMKIEAKL